MDENLFVSDHGMFVHNGLTRTLSANAKDENKL